MRSVDTNALVRFLVDDGGEQHDQAKSAFAAGELFVGVTVILEAEWVLRSRFGFGKQPIVEAFRSLAGAAGLRIEDESSLAQALVWTEAGLDFADALHLARSVDCTAFLTFDQQFARRAAAVATLPVVRL